MTITLVKIFSALLLPLPIAITLLIIAIATYRYRALCLTSACGSLVILLLASINHPTDAIIHSLEKQYQPITVAPPNVHQIVVLGAGVRGNRRLPPNTQLNSASLARLVEGVRLYHLLEQDKRPVKLILSGGSVFQSPHEAGVLANTATLLGVNRNQLTLERGAVNTAEEAQYLKHRLHNEPFLLVTSATHMPRAMMLFTRAGLHPIAAPTQFIEQSNRFRASQYWIPAANNMVRADIAIHEYLGRWWSQLTYYTNNNR